jgi:signal recognition particle receptor subunit beta
VAIIDRQRDEIVIRIVYDGPPLAGKTTTLQALCGMLAEKRRSELFTPGQAEGRTLFFDWVDYLGGWFDGLQVRCQLVSVPGQRSLGSRRRLLLRDADVVVLVLDSSPAGAQAALEALQELRALVDRPGEPPVPIILQANKQDLPGAVSADAIRARVSEQALTAVVGSSAEQGTGIREVFALAVRLALDRSRVLARASKLDTGEPAVRSGSDLLTWLESQERSPAGGAEAQARADSSASAPAVAAAVIDSDGPVPRAPQREAARVDAASSQPVRPDSRVPSGLVWPPMAGRIVLQELEGLPMRWVRLRDAWLGAAGGRFHLLTRDADVFSDMELGRQHLLTTARLHTTLVGLMSERRALALAESHDGAWRLWHVVRVESCLEDEVEQLVEHPEDPGIAAALFESADLLLTAAQRFRDARAPWKTTLRHVGGKSGDLRFVGIVSAPSSAGEVTARPAEILRREFGPFCERVSRHPGFDAPRAVAKLREVLRGRPERAEAIEALVAMVIGH